MEINKISSQALFSTSLPPPPTPPTHTHTKHHNTQRKIEGSILDKQI